MKSSDHSLGNFGSRHQRECRGPLFNIRSAPTSVLRHRSVVVAAILMGGLGCSSISAQTVTVPPTTYAAGQPAVVTSNGEITTGNNAVVVSAPATVTFHAATKVTLKPGFHAVAGTKFFIQIGGALDTDGDGIPNLWEIAHGLNPNNAGDAQNIMPGGTYTYRGAYQMGFRSVISAPQADGGNTTQLKIHNPGTP